MKLKSTLFRSLTLKRMGLFWGCLLGITGCTWEQMSNPLLWGLQFLAARQVYQGPPQPQLPRPLKPPLAPERAPAYQITQTLSSLDSHGLRRIQIWVETAAAREQYKYIYRDLVQQHHTTQDVLWMTLSHQGRPLSQAEWFAGPIAPHQRYRTLRQEELYAGVYIAYQP